MPFSSGVFSLAAGNPVVTSTTISSTWANNTMSDLATGLSSCVLKDGTQTITANIPMSSFKFTGLGAGSAAGDSLRYEQPFTSGTLSLPAARVSVSGDLALLGNASASGSLALGTTLFVGTTASVSGALNMAQAAVVTSTATVAIGAMTGNYAVVTGTATVSSFDSVRAGALRILEWSGATPIDHNSSLILPNSVKIAAQTGQLSIFVSEGSAVWRMVNMFPSKQPTIQVFTTGSAATYTTPTGTTRIRVRMVGGGGGGAAEATNNGNNGNDTTFTDGSTTWTAAKGLGGSTAGGAGGAGGAGTNGDINISGGSGGGGGVAAAVSNGNPGGQGGNSVFGGGGGGGGGTGTVGLNGGTNSGGGGGGAGGTTAPANSGGGGGAGGYVEKLIKAPAASYTYTVGTGGTGGAAGGVAGGTGATGIIIVEEWYD